MLRYARIIAPIWERLRCVRASATTKVMHQHANSGALTVEYRTIARCTVETLVAARRIVIMPERHVSHLATARPSICRYARPVAPPKARHPLALRFAMLWGPQQTALAHVSILATLLTVCRAATIGAMHHFANSPVCHALLPTTITITVPLTIFQIDSIILLD